MVKNFATQDLGPTVAIELLIRQGYNTTSVEELADAAGISRSTFFRKFGSKEDMVFADHERILAQAEADLAAATLDPLSAVVDAALMVFDQHIHNRVTTLLRNQLLHQVRALRDRELVTTHRYERAFRHHLQSALPEAGREYAAVAFAAAIVAVHNQALRQWLQDAASGADEQLDKEMAAQLRQELRALVGIFRPTLFPSLVPESHRPTVVVTVLEAGSETEEILDAVRDALS